MLTFLHLSFFFFYRTSWKNICLSSRLSGDNHVKKQLLINVCHQIFIFLPPPSIPLLCPLQAFREYLIGYGWRVFDKGWMTCLHLLQLYKNKKSLIQALSSCTGVTRICAVVIRGVEPCYQFPFHTLAYLDCEQGSSVNQNVSPPLRSSNSKISELTPSSACFLKSPESVRTSQSSEIKIYVGISI